MARLAILLLLCAPVALAGLYDAERVGCLDDVDRHQLHYGTTVHACTRDRLAARLATLDRRLGLRPDRTARAAMASL